MSIKGRLVTWSPQGWLLATPGQRTENDVKKLTFSEISYAVLDTANESAKVLEEMTDAVEKNKLDNQRRLLKSAAAQFVAAGQAYNSNPSKENEKTMQDADAVLGHMHKKTLELMQQHQEKRFNVDSNTQRGYLIKEMDESVGLLKAWQGQIEMMQIDADSFYAAVDRVVRAYTSIIKDVLKTQGKDAQIPLAQQVKSFAEACQKYRDIFLPREAKKWNNTDVYSEEDKIFDQLASVDQAIRSHL